MQAERCAAPGCGRFVRRGDTVCGKHASLELNDLSPREEPASGEAASEFARRMTGGDYRQLFGETLREVIEQAAAEPGLADEIGILRVVLARLIVVEQDAPRLAESVARVVSVAIQAARAQRAIGGTTTEEFSEMVNRILAEI
jgi:hypothetical protein